jgi:hypothetical protein
MRSLLQEREASHQGVLVVSCSVADVGESAVAVRRLAELFIGEAPTPFILRGSARHGDELVLVLGVSNFILETNPWIVERRIQHCRFKNLEGDCSFGSH